MPRKHGAKAVAQGIKKLSKSKGYRHSRVRSSMVQSRLSAQLTPIRSHVEPGTKVRPRLGETVGQMMNRMSKMAMRRRISKTTRQVHKHH